MISVTFQQGQPKTKLAKRLFKIARILNKLLRFRLTVQDGNTRYVFFPTNAIEYYRAVTFFTKEEGTIAWLKNFLKPGEVLFDIGANVGLYSLYAAKLGRNVKVYAFEPHKFTFANLMDNIANNQLQNTIFPIAIPLDETNSPQTLNYASVDSGSSMSQVGHNIHPENGAFTPKLSELIYCVALDELIDKKMIPAPHHIKIDVDGNELKILRGMKNLLSGASKPRSIQVEINPGQKKPVTEFLTSFGYRVDHAHFTADGKIKKERGEAEETIAHNIVYSI